MNTANLLMALDMATALMARATAWNAAVRDANQAGRDMTDAEVQTLRDTDDKADQALEAAIKAKVARELS
jgi:hypothetical protein